MNRGNLFTSRNYNVYRVDTTVVVQIIPDVLVEPYQSADRKALLSISETFDTACRLQLKHLHEFSFTLMSLFTRNCHSMGYQATERVNQLYSIRLANMSTA